MALPEQTTYRTLAKRAGWFLANLDGCIFWVDEDGSVIAETSAGEVRREPFQTISSPNGPSDYI